MHDEAYTEVLLDKRNEALASIYKLKEELKELSFKIWVIEGNCPVCCNPHYPFCPQQRK
jgi:hypothetical protein